MGKHRGRPPKMPNGIDLDDFDELKFSYDFDSGKGAVTEVKNIYRSAKDPDGEWQWVDECPDDIKEAAENDETEKVALVVRNKKSTDSRKKLEADSIIIQSPWLKKALSEILKDYPGVTCELHRLIFHAPFAPFVHRWKELTAYMDRPDLEAKTKEHLDLLLSVLKVQVGDVVQEYNDYVLNGVSTFDSLWTIFQPGSVVLSKFKGPLSAFELESTAYLETECGRFLRVQFDCVDWDGMKFGRYPERIAIPEFLGTRRITTLDVFPISFCETQEEIKEALIERGKKFEELAGHHYRS
jgi:hypothetical protein